MRVAENIARELPMLRRWQQYALDQLQAVDKRLLTVMAFTGAGKTRLALELVSEALRSGVCNRIIAVTPRDDLRRQWVQMAWPAGLRVDTTVSGVDADYGLVTTYQQVVADPKAIRAIAAPRHKVFAVLDEIHHVADNAAWGDALLYALHNAERVLSLTATPFRHGEGQIAFVEYQDGQAVVDYAYPFKDALADGVVSPLHFEMVGGVAEWERGGARAATVGDALGQRDQADQLRAILKPGHDWLDATLQMAIERLDTMRGTNRPRAQGMVKCIDQAHAAAVADVLEELDGETPWLVHTGVQDAGEKLMAFKAADARWLVVVGMGDEGYDNVRLKVGVWATNVTTALSLYQWAGRFARTDPAVGGDQTGVLYVPNHPLLRQYAEEIDVVRYHTVEEIRERQERELRREASKAGPDLTPIKSEAAPAGTIAYSATDLVMAIRARSAIALDAVTDAAIREIARQALAIVGPVSTGNGGVVAPPADDPFVKRQREQFERLVDEVSGLPLLGRQILVYMLRFPPGQDVPLADVCAGIAQSERNVRGHKPRWAYLVSQGFIEDVGEGGRRALRNAARDALQARFRDLPAEWMLRRLSEVGVE